ncbi:putative bifunctional diguanylate cyclase/phosphodiesterase [Aeromonas simiae]|uniref:putative bifunctional diguanylate cyclase/phosphodiesterase n=1 Tax=Aeromonas simiae TaxID=218936 RepID=UPI00266BEECB|nr:EAL domain-containing protein [Aeromonas simiae]MDO2948444.1 EAL domain-containing protein [Aeromonas simiae]MDO2951889.1 EAL domain-containing protein [Aeromonas simiae]MDO2955827.1 EAL domain-containing protein [Aeromonas simiae]
MIPDWLQQVLDSLPLSLFCRDLHGNYLFCNHQFARQAGVDDPRDLLGRNDSELPWGERYREEDRRLLQERRPLISQHLLCEQEEGEIWIQTHKVPFYDKLGNPLGLFGLIEEISHLKGLEEALSAHQQLQRKLLDAIPDLILLFRADGSVLESNQALLDFFDLPRGHATWRQPGSLPPALFDITQGPSELTLKDALGHHHVLEVTRLEVPNLGEPATLSLCRDVTRQRSAEQQLRQARQFDSLTGLLKLTTFLERAQQGDDRPVCLLMVDLQHFHEINARFGIRVADLLLGEVATRLQLHAPVGSQLCRVSADDFCLLVPQEQLGTERRLWGEWLRRRLAAPYSVAGHRIQIDCHIGIAEGTSHAVESLLHHAEAALVEAKQTRQHFFSFDAELEGRIRRRRLLEQALPRAIHARQLHLAYQPIIASGTGALLGAEVLCRWHHEELGPVPPDEFIPLAEQLGLIGALGSLVIQRAAQQCAEWRAQQPELRLSVNLSPLQFRQPSLCRELLQAVQAWQLPPAALELEITESVLMENADEIDNNLRQLLAAGFPLAIDDFGTGYCSLAYLPRLQVSNLKLDRSFIRELESNPVTTAIVRSVIGLAHEIGMQITAEGVETEAQRDWLIAAGCQRLQGYLFSQPLPAEAFAARFLGKR